MRVLLVRPPVPPRTIGLKNVMICEPLELEYVAAGLEGHEVQVMDMILERGFERRLREFRPDVVGTSCYITGVNEVKKLCRTVKRYSPTCFTVVGGVQAARCPDDFIEPAIDCIALGDGTTVMRDIVDALAAERPLTEIPGLALRHEGHLHRTAPADYMPDPDTLPLPRRDLVAHLRHRYYYAFHQPVALMKTTWGCWYKCNFCYTWRITDGRVYSRSPESIAEELEAIDADDVSGSRRAPTASWSPWTSAALPIRTVSPSRSFAATAWIPTVLSSRSRTTSRRTGSAFGTSSMRPACTT